MEYLTALGHQSLAWAAGLAATLVFLDSGPGMSRDHPPLGWRLPGTLVGPLAAVGALCLATSSQPLLSLALGLPFAATAAAYSVAWLRHVRARRRRIYGYVAAITGGVSMLALMLTAGPVQWNGGLVIGAYAGSAALLGGLTAALCIALTSAAPDEIAVRASPYGVPARVAAVGFGVTLLGMMDVGFAALSGFRMPLQMGLWMLLSLVVPLMLMAAGHGLFPRFQRPIWAGAFGSALVGQWAFHLLLLQRPGLIPPNPL